MNNLKHILIEVVIVVIGLLIAFQIDRWYEDYKERKLERKILNEIKNSLLFDLNDLNLNLENHKRCMVYYDSVKSKLQGKAYDPVIGEYLDMIFRDLLFSPNSASYESLKNLGTNIVSDDSLRIELSNLYEFYYPLLIKLEESYAAGQHFDKYYDVTIKNFSKWEFVNGKFGLLEKLESEPKNFASLRSDPELQILLNFTHRQRIFVKLYYETTIKNVTGVIDRIDGELKE